MFALAGALDESWRETLDAVARQRGMPTSNDPRRVSPLVARLSAIYNDQTARAPAAGDKDSLAARLLFSFARDVPKASAAVRELAALGLLRGRPLRMLDVGAGLGAMTWGVARMLDPDCVLEADLVDRDRAALELADAIAKNRNDGRVRIRTRVADRAEQNAFGNGYDLIVAGQVLSELERERPDEDRVARHVAWTSTMIARLAPTGSLVIVEPALRDRTRHLHRLRQSIIDTKTAKVFAPCLHEGPCPMLVRESDWCHEDLPVDLPEWLVPIARGAGLRFEGLTFSYLVLRRDETTLASAFGPAGAYRDVSGLLRTKGKTERILCGRGPGLETGGSLRGLRLDRAESDVNAAWGEAPRGAVFTFGTPLDPARPRIEATTETRTDSPVDASKARS